MELYNRKCKHGIGDSCMRILHLEYSGNTGGIEKLCKDIGVCSSHDENYFLFVHEAGTIYEEMQAEYLNVECLYLKNKEIIKLYRYVDKYVKKYNIDVIVIHHPSPLIWLAMILYQRKRKRAKVVTYVHNTYLEIVRNSCIKSCIYNRLLKKTDAIVAISNCVKQSVIDNVTIQKNKIKVIYNGTTFSNRDVDTEARDFHNPIRLIYIGRLIEKKGVQFLIDAFSELIDKEKYSLTIVGDGEYREKLEGKVRKSNLSEYINFLGNQRNVNDLLSNADIFIHPAIWEEGFGITIIEAMARGKLCIASKRGAIPEIISDGVNGLLVESANAKQLAEKIKYVGEIMPKKERERIQENALRDVKRFSIDVLIENLHELYNCIYRENK